MPHLKIGELAHQAQGVGIFVHSTNTCGGDGVALILIPFCGSGGAIPLELGSTSVAKWNPVHILAAERVKLACKRQGEESLRPAQIPAVAPVLH